MANDLLIHMDDGKFGVLILFCGVLILFCIYTMELSCLLERHRVSFQLFVDDNQCYMALNDISDAEDKLSDLLVDVGNWMKSKQLK